MRPNRDDSFILPYSCPTLNARGACGTIHLLLMASASSTVLPACYRQPSQETLVATIIDMPRPMFVKTGNP